jgi:hypothetical protein
LVDVVTKKKEEETIISKKNNRKSKPFRWWPSDKSLGPKGLLPL